ncbi:hypothetical protein OKA05_08730 [Luteolibacter arcticus]|uniref:Uncharacterized protein n=1 Tax=Luteolibacter arcticus TaxID=1581411 RepID=A0ABT3GG93_9BACT|nr:hypothetical protein [Luteolibacter arcticus]MCW1922637.1 hypothetical protein [Luteolibacter arcticus]
MSTTLRFDQKGGIECLYTEEVDLRSLGRLHVVRATEIAFDQDEQRWEVRCAASGKLLHSDPSRAACLAWEQTHLQPGTPVRESTKSKSRSIMKKSIIVILVLAAVLAACGPDKAKLRAELQSIDAELVQIRSVAGQYRARMSAAEFDAFVGSFAAGYGAVSGDYQLAGDGVGTAVESALQYDASSISLDQLKQRHEQLAKRRTEIVPQLD